jgi:hypothetical protein
MPPCNCGGKKTNSTSSAQAMAALGAKPMANFTNDNEMEMIRYMSPNRGDHPVWGGVTRKFYGHRKGAGVETFLVHRSDIAAQPHFFTVISDVPAPPQVVVSPPPPPVAINAPVPPPAKQVELEPGPIKQAELEPVLLKGEVPPPDIAARAINDAKFDLQALPGVTPNIARGMAELSLVTAEAVMDAGVDGLRKVRGVGKTKAEMIYSYVTGNFARSSD